MFLHSELTPVESTDDLEALTRNYCSAIAAVGSEVEASLVIEYERKCYREVTAVCSPGETKSPYRDDSVDNYLLTIQVRVPMRFVAGDLYSSVVETTTMVKTKKEKELRAKRDMLEEQIATLNKQISDL